MLVRGHRVDAARVPRMAAAEAACGQPAAAQRTMGLERLDGIAGTGRVEAAVLPEHRGQHEPVGAHDPDEQGFHETEGAGTGPAARRGRWEASRRDSSACSRRLSALLVAGPALVFTGRARRTMQSTATISLVRNSSRVTRLIVFRVTARGAKRLAATMPSRAWGSGLGRGESTKCADF